MSPSKRFLRTLHASWGIFLVVLILLVSLRWVYQQAELLDPQEHHRYEQLIADVRELDARFGRESLALRLGLAQNYDAVTDLSTTYRALLAQLLEPPRYLNNAHRHEVEEAARSLVFASVDRVQLIEDFKRNHAVLKNSQAYFPVVVEECMHHIPGDQASLARLVESYARHVLGADHRGDQVVDQRTQDLTASLSVQRARHPLLDAVLAHGSQILLRQTQLDDLTRKLLRLDSHHALGSLKDTYEKAYAVEQHRASTYRLGVYVLGALLSLYLATVFMNLERARQRLHEAHAEISQRLAAQSIAERQLRLHSTAFRNSHDGIALTDHQGNIVDVNPAFSRITGWNRGEVLGRNPRMLRSGRHDAAFYDRMWTTIRDTGNWTGEIWNRNKFGEIYPELLSISAVRDEGGAVSNYVAVFSDIRRLKAQEHQLTRMAYYDALTELPNRVLLADSLTLGVAEARRTQTLLAVCYLDLDGFKPINDTWGHDAGDRVLVEVARRLKDSLRAGDTVARIGGDEFVVLLQGLANVDECDMTCRRLLDLLSQPLAVVGDPVHLSASMGVAIYPLDDVDADTLLRHADQAMYIAKQSGKNRHHVFDAALDRDTRSRSERLARLRDAVRQDEMRLFFQPKVNMRTGSVLGFEALIRWVHPERGVLAPGEFLPLIEDDNLICEVGDWVLDAALAQMAVWVDQGQPLHVSINLAGRHLQRASFVTDLASALRRYPTVDPTTLELEVLETTGLEDVVRVSRLMTECQALGVNFAIDDFGTGYSSLTYLKRLPAETVKIDQSFVREILNDANNLAIVHSVTRLAGSFQRKVVAEGVETADHGRMLLQLGCELGQGYGIARPMPAGDVLGWLAAWRAPDAWLAVSGMHWTEAVYPVLLAEVEHRGWVDRLTQAVQDGMAPPHDHIDDIHSCRFGRWYDIASATQALWTRTPAFRAIRLPHENVHVLAGDMDRAWRDGRLSAAQALLPGLRAASERVLSALRGLAVVMATQNALPPAPSPDARDNA